MNKTYKEWLKYYENATKEEVIEDMYKDIQEIKQLRERIDKVIEYITSEEYFFLNNQKTGSFCEDTNNYMKAHDKLLEILKGENNNE